MVRARRIVVLALILPTVVLVSACGGGGGGGGDKDAITSLINNVSKNPKTLCSTSVATDNYFAVSGITRAQCVEASAGQKSTVSKITAVKVSGDKGTAHVADANGNGATLSFVKQGGKWLVDSQKQD